MNNILSDDPVMIELRKKYPKQGPDPKPGETLDEWAKRYIQYIREKHHLEDKDG